MLKIDYKNHPKRSLYSLLKEYGPTQYLTMDTVLQDEDHYSAVYQDLLDILKYGMEYKVIREWPIRFVFHASDVQGMSGEEIIEHSHVLELRHFLSNLCLWYAFMKLECVEVMNEEFIMDWKGKKAEDIAKYVDRFIIPYEDVYQDEGFHTVNAIVDDIIYNIKAISDAFCLIFGYSASIWDIMQAEESIPEIHELMYAEIDPTLQPKEMEDLLRQKNERLIELFSSIDTDLRPLLQSGKNISSNQFKEIFLRTGFKADLSSRTIPWYLDMNLLRTGLWLPSYFFIIAMSGRKAQMDSKLKMSKPGALSKKMNHSATPVILREDNEICDSTRPVSYTIEDETFLRMLDKRNYYDDDDGGKMKTLDGWKDTHLIGKKIRFRSPCTCTSKNGICRACYGELFNINKDLFSQGSLAAKPNNHSYVAA